MKHVYVVEVFDEMPSEPVWIMHSVHATVDGARGEVVDLDSPFDTQILEVEVKP